MNTLLKTFTLMLIISCFALPAAAQKDSFYYMKDDGIFSPEEKDEEAELIKQKCEQSVMPQQYFNCACIAGAFRVKRDEPKLTPQNHILVNLYSDKNSPCVDPVKIAGNMYGFCMGYAKVFRSRKTDNKEFCECAANKVAKDFSEQSILKTRYIEHINVNALKTCNRRPDKIIAPQN